MWSKQIEHHDGKAFLVKFKSLNWLKLQSNWLKLLNTNRGNVFSPFCSFRYWQFRTWIVGGNEIWVLSHFLSSSFHQEIWPNLKVSVLVNISAQLHIDQKNQRLQGLRNSTQYLTDSVILTGTDLYGHQLTVAGICCKPEVSLQQGIPEQGKARPSKSCPGQIWHGTSISQWGLICLDELGALCWAWASLKRREVTIVFFRPASSANGI